MEPPTFGNARVSETGRIAAFPSVETFRGIGTVENNLARLDRTVGNVFGMPPNRQSLLNTPREKDSAVWNRGGTGRNITALISILPQLTQGLLNLIHERRRVIEV